MISTSTPIPSSETRITPEQARRTLASPVEWKMLLHAPNAFPLALTLIKAITSEDEDVTGDLPHVAARALDTVRHMLGGADQTQPQEILRLLDRWLASRTAPPVSQDQLRHFSSPELVSFLPRFWGRESDFVLPEARGSARPREFRDAIALGWGFAPFHVETWKARWASLTKHPHLTIPEQRACAAMIESWRRAGAPTEAEPAGTWPTHLARGGEGIHPIVYRAVLGKESSGLVSGDTKAQRGDTDGLMALLADPIDLRLWVALAHQGGHDAGHIFVRHLLRGHMADSQVLAAAGDALALWLERAPHDEAEQPTWTRFWKEVENASRRAPALEDAIDASLALRPVARKNAAALSPQRSSTTVESRPSAPSMTM